MLCYFAADIVVDDFALPSIRQSSEFDDAPSALLQIPADGAYSSNQRHCIEQHDNIRFPVC